MATGNRIVFSGVDAFKEQLRHLPADLTSEATQVVVDAANDARAMIDAGYHQGKTGNLRKGLFIRTETLGPFAIALKVVSASPLAWLYDNGSRARHYVRKGKEHATGAMWGARGSEPPTHLFVKTIITRRRKMYASLRELLIAHGMTVTGDAG